MKKAWRERPWSTSKFKFNTTTPIDIPVVSQKRLEEKKVDAFTQSLQNVQQAFTEAETRFPFTAYQAVIREAHQIVLDRDGKGRNAYLSFYEGFPHGFSDASFEAHRRVARVIGVERQLANSFAADAVALKQVMRQDLLDLVNYSAFAIMLLDKEAEGTH
jgi:hypothetical protein